MIGLSIHFRILPSEFMRRCTVPDLLLLQAYHHLHPFGPDQDIWRNALSCYVVAASNGAKDSSIQDFIPSTETKTDYAKEALEMEAIFG